MKTYIYSFATLVAVSLFAVSAQSQTVNVDQKSLLQRLSRSEHRLQAVEQKLFVMPGGGGENSLADMEIRVQELEKEGSTIYGSVEQLANTVEKLASRMDKLAEDLELRLQDIEQSQLSKQQLAKTKQLEKEKILKASEPAAIKRPKNLDVPKDLSPEDHYRKAYGHLTSANYAVAQRWLDAFLERHAEHELADNAHYWLGEVYLVQDKPERAAIAFKNGLKAFPKGKKAAAHLLKMGLAFQRLKKNHHARSSWEKLVADYKDTPEARKAERYLSDLGPK